MGLANGIQISEVTSPVAFNQDLRAIVPPNGVDSRFLLLALRHRLADGGKKVLSSAAHGTLKIDAAALRQIEFPVPPIEVQRRIVASLDEAFEGIAIAKANAEKSLRGARELFESHHQSVFTAADDATAFKRLGDLATFRNGINYTKQSKGHTVPIIGVKDFQNHFWAPIDDLDSVTLDGSLSTTDTVVPGDILAVRSNGNPELIGRCMVVGNVDEPITHSGFTIRIKLICPDAPTPTTFVVILQISVSNATRAALFRPSMAPSRTTPCSART